MLNIGFTPIQILQKGLWLGFLATLIGGFVFTSLELFLSTLIFTERPNSPLDFVVIMASGLFLFVSIGFFTLLPNLVGGVVMVWMINQYSQYKPIFKTQAMNIGGGIGMAIAFFYVFIIGLAIGPYLDKGAENFFIYQALGALTVASFTGVFMGYKVINPLLEQTKKLIQTAVDPDVHFTAETE